MSSRDMRWPVRLADPNDWQNLKLFVIVEIMPVSRQLNNCLGMFHVQSVCILYHTPAQNDWTVTGEMASSRRTYIAYLSI